MLLVTNGFHADSADKGADSAEHTVTGACLKLRRAGQFISDAQLYLHFLRTQVCYGESEFSTQEPAKLPKSTHPKLI
ncbi:MAG: hypothetical protein LHW51_06755 [Candidatus Cloacimonetes bacterium]|nr:hypothetical protein [Candidatus Cloacimonadota bacterium]